MVRASLPRRDTRNSELKVDAYRALSDEPEAVAGDVVDDVATVDEVLATLAGLELPADIRSAIDAVGEVNREFGAFIVEYVDLAQSDPDAALARIDEIADRNHELDDTPELNGEIGSAPVRERGWQSVEISGVDVSYKNKNTHIT